MTCKGNVLQEANWKCRDKNYEDDSMRSNGSHRGSDAAGGRSGESWQALHLLAHLEIVSQDVTNSISCHSFAKVAFISRANLSEPGQPEAYERN
jgi:hypothetical protein